MAPKVNLKATVLPLQTVRATMVGDLLANHGFSQEQIDIAQRGYLAGWLDRVIIAGIDYAGYAQDVITLWFDKIEGEPKVSVDVTGGRSMLEAVSVPLAGAVDYGVKALKRKGLRPTLFFGYASWLDAAEVEKARTALNLNGAPLNLSPAAGYAMREIVYVSPATDRGAHYQHQQARRIK